MRACSCATGVKLPTTVTGELVSLLLLSAGDSPLLLRHPHLAIEGEILPSCFARFDQIERQIRNILEDATDPIVLHDQQIPMVGSFQALSNTVASLRITGTHDSGKVVTGMRLAEEIPIFLYHVRVCRFMLSGFIFYQYFFKKAF